MHQNLFELSLSPIPEDERVTENSFETGDIPMADWWGDEENRERAILSFTQMLNANYEHLVQVNPEKETVTFLPGFKQAWLRNKYETVQAIALKIIRMTEEEFGKWGTVPIRDLSQCVDDEFGTYVYTEAGGYAMTLDSWIHFTDLDNTTWYIGGIIDWHC